MEVAATRRRADEPRLPTLRGALEGLTVPDLRAAAARLGSRLTRKVELVALLEEHLREPANLRRILGSLDERGRAAVAEAAHGDGRLRPLAFAAKYGGTLRPAGTWLGVLFFGDWQLPEDLRARLQPLVAAPAPAALTGLAELPPEEDAGAGDEPRSLRLTERAAAADLAAVLRLCDAGGLRCSETTRRPGTSTLRAVEGVLEEGDFYADGAIAAFAWPLLVQAGGLAELAGGRLQLTARGRRALQAPPHETLRALWQRWLERGCIDEFSRIEALKGQQSASGRNLTAVPPRRAAVAAALAEAPAGHWIAVDAFFRHVRSAEHDFEVVHDPWRLYLVDAQYGGLGDTDYGGWSLVQGRFALCLLFEYAATLGLIDVAYTDPAGARDDYAGCWGSDSLDALSRYDGLQYFRVNALGAYCLGGAPAYPPPAGAGGAGRPALRLLPNLDLVWTGERLPAADRLLLERYAAPRSERVWALRRELLLAAAARGGGGEELEAFLRERVEPPLPETALALLAEVRTRAGRMRDLGPARLVECADANLALELAHDRRLRGLCFPVGERLLAVPPGAEDAFRRALWDVGYTLPPAGEPGTAEAQRAPAARRRAAPS